MFNRLIERASLLISRLEVVKRAYDADALATLSHAQQIAWTDIDGWFNAAADVITQAFGEHSRQGNRWDHKSKEIDSQERRDALVGKFHSIDSIIYKINAMKGMLVEFQDVWEAKARKTEIERKHAMSNAVSIHGGIFVGSQVGGIANSMNTYVEQLKLNEYSSSEEKDLKHALAELRKRIEATEELSGPEKAAASTDLALLTDQLVKPAEKQDQGAKKLFWERLTNILTVSAGLGNLASVVAKLAGLE